MKSTSLTDYERLAPDLSYYDLLETARLQGYRIDKYEDPTEGARTGLTVAEAAEIAQIDAGLIALTRGAIS